MSKPKLKLVGEDGNAFSILGRALRVAKKAGWTQAKIDKFKEKATFSDYNNLLKVCGDFFDVS